MEPMKVDRQQKLQLQLKRSLQIATQTSTEMQGEFKKVCEENKELKKHLKDLSAKLSISETEYKKLRNEYDSHVDEFIVAIAVSDSLMREKDALRNKLDEASRNSNILQAKVSENDSAKNSRHGESRSLDQLKSKNLTIMQFEEQNHLLQLEKCEVQKENHKLCHQVEVLKKEIDNIRVQRDELQQKLLQSDNIAVANQKTIEDMQMELVKLQEQNDGLKKKIESSKMTSMKYEEKINLLERDFQSAIKDRDELLNKVDTLSKQSETQQSSQMCSENGNPILTDIIGVAIAILTIPNPTLTLLTPAEDHNDYEVDDQFAPAAEEGDVSEAEQRTRQLKLLSFLQCAPEAEEGDVCEAEQRTRQLKLLSIPLETTT